MLTTRRSVLASSSLLGFAAAERSYPALAQQTSPGVQTPGALKAIDKDAFLWGMHPVAIYHLRYNQAQNEKSPEYVGINRLRWCRKPMTAVDRFATTPNATTLYGPATRSFCLKCNRAISKVIDALSNTPLCTTTWARSL
jgi:hypothetical protein